MSALLPVPIKMKRAQGGFSLVEVVVVSAIVLLVFGGLFTGLRYMIELIGHSKAESGARSLAVAKMEYIRSLPYESVGTEGGIPDGPLPQISTTMLNGITYTERILVQYLDRPEDGFGATDENGVTEDSKIVKVEYTWELRGKERSLAMVSDIIPRGIESTTGGGTLFINVFDARIEPVAGATVHVYNDTGTTTIDVTVTTNEAGIANFPGAPALSGYQITATKDGYSTDRTYSATAGNSSPNPPHVSVLEGAVSTVNFAIDQLGSLTLKTERPPVTEVHADTFDDTTNLFSQSGTEVTGGELTLAYVSGAYQSSGTAYMEPVTPSLLSFWSKADVTGTSGSETSYRVRVFAAAGSGTTTTFTPLPDEVLPGNAAGFTAGPIDLAGVDAAAYPTLALGAELTTTDTAQTPALIEWSIEYVEGVTPIAGVTISVRGGKSIGLHDGAQVPKYTATVTTDETGTALLPALEWDSYNITINGEAEGYDIAEVTGVVPYALDPGAEDNLTFILVPHTEHSFHITLMNTEGSFVPNATVTITGEGSSHTSTTGAYGQTIFEDIESGTYELSVEAAGYDTYVGTNISIGGQSALTVTLPSGT